MAAAWACPSYAPCHSLPASNHRCRSAAMCSPCTTLSSTLPRCWAGRRPWRTCAAPLPAACPSLYPGRPSPRSPSRCAGSAAAVPGLPWSVPPPGRPGAGLHLCPGLPLRAWVVLLCWLPHAWERCYLPTRRYCLWVQVVLDTVELVLSAAEQSPAPTPVSSVATLEPSASEPSLAAVDEAAAAAGSGSGWFGSTLQSMALRAGLHVTGAPRCQAACAALHAPRHWLLSSCAPTPARLPLPPRSPAVKRGAQVGARGGVCGGRNFPAAAAADEHGRVAGRAQGEPLPSCACALSARALQRSLWPVAAALPHTQPLPPVCRHRTRRHG